MKIVDKYGRPMRPTPENNLIKYWIDRHTKPLAFNLLRNPIVDLNGKSLEKSKTVTIKKEKQND